MAVVINVVGKTNLADLAKASAEMDKLRRDAEKMAQGVGGSIQKFGQKVSDVGQGMANVGDKMSKTVTLPVIAAGGAFLKMSTDLNKGMANVQALGVAEERVRELKTGVQDLAVVVGKSTDDLSEGLYNVVSAFGDSSDSMKILETNARAATAGLASTTDAINLTSAVTKGYGDVSAAAVTKASDLALKTVELGQTTFPELAASIGKVTPLASALNVSQEELFGTMATFTGVTGGAAEVSTQLRGVMQGLMQPTADMSALMESLGVESGAAMVEQFGLQESLNLIVKAAEDAGQPLGKYLSSIEGQTIALAATGGQADAYTDKIKAMSGAAGTTDAAFKAQTEGINAAGFQMEQAKQQAIVLGQRLGDTLAPMLIDVFDAAKPLVAKVEEAVAWFTSLDETQQRNIVKWVAMVAAMGPVLSITGRILKPIGSMIRGVGKVTSVTIKAARAMPALTRAVRVYGWTAGKAIGGAARAAASGTATAVRALASWVAAGARWVASQVAQAAKATASMVRTAAQFVAQYVRMAAASLAQAARMAASWIIAMGPVAWVIAGVVALVALIIANWDKVVRATRAAWEWVGDKVKAVWQWIKDTTRAAVDGVVAFFGNLKDRAVALVTGLVRWLIDHHPMVMLWRLAQEWVPKVVSWFVDLKDRALSVVANLRDRVVGFFTGIKDRAVKIVTTMKENLVGNFNRIVEFVTGLPAKIRTAASGMWDGLKDAFRGAINWIIDKWNRLEFRIPGFDPPGPGPKFSGFTLGLPDIPRLQMGAIVPATPGGRHVVTSEAGADEAVIPLPHGWRNGRSGPLAGGISVAKGAVSVTVVLQGDPGDHSALARTVRKAVNDALADVVDGVAYGAGAA
jgi:TP901 family phage tail tape measure protein